MEDSASIEVVREVVSTSIKLYALMTPPAVLSAFISATSSYSSGQKAMTAAKTSIAIFVIGVVLFLFGSNLFSLFGFTLDAFRIGAGILLFLTAVSLMKEDDNKQIANHDGDISVVPLAIPLGMGPASIGAVMVMGATADSTSKVMVGVASLLIAALGMYLLLRMASGVVRILRRTGIAVLAKLTGLLLAAIAAQVVFTGISAFL